MTRRYALLAWGVAVLMSGTLLRAQAQGTQTPPRGGAPLLPPAPTSPNTTPTPPTTPPVGGTTQTTAPQGPPAPVLQTPLPAGASPFSLDVSVNAANAPTLTRPSSGVLAVGLVYAGKTSVTDVHVAASAFTAGGRSIVVTPVTCDDPTKPAPPLSVTPNSISRVCLQVPEISDTAKYGGALFIAAGDRLDPFPLNIVAPVVLSGVLSLDQLTVTRTVNRWLFGWQKLEQFFGSPLLEATVTLREKTGAPIEGLAVRLEQATGPASGLDLNRNMTFVLNGEEIDLASSPMGTSANKRRIAAGGQASVKVVVHDLVPGEYTGVLHFVGSNSADDPAQKLQLILHVRDSWLWAVLTLIVALLLSFVSTKVLSSERRRADILQRIRRLQPAWVATLPPAPAVVWTQAVLHKARRLSRRVLLTNPDLIDANLTSVATVLDLLDAARQMRQRLALALDALLFERAAFMLERVTSRIGAGPQDDSTMQRLRTDLAAFEDWLNKEKFPGIFWNTITPALQALHGRITDAEIPPEALDLFKELHTTITTAFATPPTTADQVEKIYREYVKLSVLWDLRSNLTGLLDSAKGDAEHFLALADDRMWERAKSQQDKLRIKMPISTDVDGIEAYDTVQFAIESSDAELEQSFLFRHKIECHWTFTLEPTQAGSDRQPNVVLTPVSLGPTVIQYFPRPGQVRVAVKLVYGGDAIELSDSNGPKIAPSSDYAVYNILARTELVSWLIAATVAMTTGLATYYFKGTSWGSFQDYLTLFLWGIGVDQGKNFLQALQTFNPSATRST